MRLRAALPSSLYQFYAINIKDEAVWCTLTSMIGAYLGQRGSEGGKDMIFYEDEFYSLSEIASSIAPTFCPTMSPQGVHT